MAADFLYNINLGSSQKQKTYLTNSASPLIMKLKLLYLLSPICRLKGKDYLMYRRLMFNFLQYIDTVCLYKTSSTSRFLSK
ncbi:hypothetical protein WANA31_0921 [Wolbachia endosymbiont of Drosophila ananassae]|nr:hypothetical protein WANA34_0963 [Wolbachia endosymbiont of Drosophila ananassae]RLT62038.1 hypothetical protein WANA31_0921 [Wolbachia endosymbiont of Drosophila ananassae]